VCSKLSYSGQQVNLHRTHSRVPWVHEDYVFTREVEPLLSHVLTSDQVTRAVKVVVDLLDAAGVSLDARGTGTRGPEGAGPLHKGKRPGDVSQALKYRRSVAPKPVPRFEEEGSE